MCPDWYIIMESAQMIRKRQKIKKGMEKFCADFGLNWKESAFLTGYILEYQNDNGVVIKVEHKCEGHPQCVGCYWQNRTVEPLIEVK